MPRNSSAIPRELLASGFEVLSSSLAWFVEPQLLNGERDIRRGGRQVQPHELRAHRCKRDVCGRPCTLPLRDRPAPGDAVERGHYFIGARIADRWRRWRRRSGNWRGGLGGWRRSRRAASSACRATTGSTTADHRPRRRTRHDRSRRDRRRTRLEVNLGNHRRLRQLDLQPHAWSLRHARRPRLDAESIRPRSARYGSPSASSSDRRQAASAARPRAPPRSTGLAGSAWPHARVRRHPLESAGRDCRTRCGCTTRWPPPTRRCSAPSESSLRCTSCRRSGPVSPCRSVLIT